MVKVYEIDGVRPVVHPTSYVHPTAVLIGDVIVGALWALHPRRAVVAYYELARCRSVSVYLLPETERCRLIGRAAQRPVGSCGRIDPGVREGPRARAEAGIAGGWRCLRSGS